MMIYVFFGTAVVLTVAAVWFLVRPLARAGHVESREQYYQLLSLRDRLLAQLNELDLDERDHSMEAATAADERARLEAELASVLKQLDTLASGAEVGAGHPRSTQTWRWIVVALALIVPAVAASLYAVNVSVLPTQLEQVAAVPAPGSPDPMQMVARLEKRLQENPGDVRGWLMLGRSYGVMGRLDDAKAAYDHAYPMLPKDYEADGPDALWFLGLAAYSRGETPRALVYWQKLLAAMPPGSDAAKQLSLVIQKARVQGSSKK